MMDCEASASQEDRKKQKWYEKWKTGVASLFEGVGPGGEKKGKGSDGRVLPGSQLGPCTFEAKQSEWLMKLMQRQGAMLGEAFDERIDLMQEDMSSLGKEVIEIKNNQAEMATKEEVKKEVR